MLDFDEAREPVTPRAAATLILVRDGDAGLEVIGMQRSLQSSFMGGAVVFPGGRVEAYDAASAWPPEVATRAAGEWWDDEGFAARMAACREALEEVGVAPIAGASPTLAKRDELRTAKSAQELQAKLRALGGALDLAALVPLARWVTPTAESRRFDARFFLARAPSGQTPSIDRKEAIRTFSTRPAELLEGYLAGAISLFPPTHRTLEWLALARDVDDALSRARGACLEPICPRFVLDKGAPTLALPGDPLHEVRTRRVEGKTRYVLRGERWTSEDAP